MMSDLIMAMTISMYIDIDQIESIMDHMENVFYLTSIQNTIDIVLLRFVIVIGKGINA